ncbi:MAG: hypothetical protein U9N34_07735 [Candidatus Cloacimonadota bacterium]|nr:hypothetical protein [Candidatus Cloacimonadota bacterium]
MSIWSNIKCFFGFCAEKREIELRQKIEIERAVDAAYKKEPIVVEIKKSEIKVPSLDKIVVKTKPKPKVKVKEEKPKSKPKSKPETKVKVKKKSYSYYNNGKKNLRVYEGEEIPEGFSKGMKPRKKKGDK